MQVARKYWIATLVLVVIVIIGFFLWRSMGMSAPAFPINSADTISSWTFKGAYTGNDTLIQQGNADIAKLKALLAAPVCTQAEASSTEESGSTACNAYDDYDLYIGIGNDDNLMGNGKGAYQNYDKAVAIHPDKGLAYANLGHLFDELGAYHTAADAYAKAVAVEPGQIEYHIERLNFLTTRFPTDSQMLLAAFTDASNQFGDVAQVLAIEATWLEGQGRYQEAIAAWQRWVTISPGRDPSAVNAQIARDEAKLKSQ